MYHRILLDIINYLNYHIFFKHDHGTEIKNIFFLRNLTSFFFFFLNLGKYY